MAGVIKSYSENHRYGFITSSSLGDDVRFQTSDLPQLMPGANIKGKLVTFEFQQMPDGKMRVSTMQFQTAKIAQSVNMGMGYGGFVPPPMAAAPMHAKGGGKGGFMALPMTAHSPQQASGGQMTGSVKSYSDRHGYGFIIAPGQQQDVKFSKSDLVGLETVTPGTAVSFTPTMTGDGRVQAKQVSLSNQGMKRGAGAAGFGNGWGGAPKQQRVGPPAITAQPQAMSTGQTLEGTVKSYIPQKGVGFITSPECAGDVYFNKAVLPAQHQMAELKGFGVTFELAMTSDGKLRAQSVVVS